MSITAVRPYFRTRLEAVGFEEWPDGFNVDNIPQTILEKVYHIESVNIAASNANQLTHEFVYSIKVRVFIRGFQNVSTALDSADQVITDILTEVLKASNRLGTSIKDIEPTLIKHLPIDESNDDDIMIELDFNAILLLCFV